MGLDFVRGNGTRCPPLLVGGLLIMCFCLLCNWWSLSSQNLELLKQIDNLAEQLKVNGEELGKCSQRKLLLDEKLKNSQDKFIQQQISVEHAKESEDEMKEKYKKIDLEMKETQKKVQSVENNLALCHTEMESVKKLSESKDKALETLRTEKESLKSEIVQKNKKIGELEEKIKGDIKNNDYLAKSKIMESLVNNLAASAKNQQKNGADIKILQENPVQQDLDHAQEDKFGVEGKNYVDSGLLSLDKDPREEEMRGS